jgi:60 kDa SS-A/Ro ribonucleoprotein
MNGVSFKLGALQTLQIVMTSMISGEPQYYRPSSNGTKQKLKKVSGDTNPSHRSCRVSQKALDFKEHFILQDLYKNNIDDVNTYINKIINDALDEDYEGTVNFIPLLREEYMMRLNPQVILVEALRHKNRIKFNKENPTKMKKIIQSAGILPTDWCKQFELMKDADYVPPSIWKRAIAEKLQKMSRYHAIKYINGGKSGNKVNVFEKKKSLASLVDLIRITHPKGPPESIISEIVKTGKASTNTDNSVETWERLRSSGKSWREIIKTIKLPHMALLRNLRNIIYEYSQLDEDVSKEVNEIGSQLIAGVEGGKQFPFRYFSAYREIANDNEVALKIANRRSMRQNNDKKNNKKNNQKNPDVEVAILPKYSSIIEKSLEMCLTKSAEMIPQLDGRVDSLTDNSGSAHGSFVSEYGSVKIAEISNLSAILSAMRATNGGSVWIFGDRLVEFRVDPQGSILKQLEQVNNIGKTIGGGTETGIWLFWDKMIKEKKHLDNVFIYSDQQAGHGGLYASEDSFDRRLPLVDKNYVCNTKHCANIYIDVLKLVKKYREIANAKMNIFSVQVAGYNNTVMPDILYRGAILSGWTGREANMAHEMIKQWNLIEEINVISRHETDKPELINLEPIKPEPVKSESNKSESNKSESIKSESIKSESIKSESNNSESIERTERIGQIGQTGQIKIVNKIRPVKTTDKKIKIESLNC